MRRRLRDVEAVMGVEDELRSAEWIAVSATERFLADSGRPPDEVEWKALQAGRHVAVAFRSLVSPEADTDLVAVTGLPRVELAPLVAAHGSALRGGDADRAPWVLDWLRAFEIPYPLGRIVQSALRGGSTARASMQDWLGVLGMVHESAWDNRPDESTPRIRLLEDFSRVCREEGLLTWTYRPDHRRPSLRAVENQRHIFAGEAAGGSRFLDVGARYALREHMRDVLIEAPHLGHRMDEVARDGLRLLISWSSEGVAISPSVEASYRNGDVAAPNPFPSELTMPQSWEQARLWKFGPSDLLVELSDDNDITGAKALIRAEQSYSLWAMKRGPNVGHAVRELHRSILQWRLDELASGRGVVGGTDPDRILGTLRGVGTDRMTARVSAGVTGSPGSATARPVGPTMEVLAEIDALVGLDSVKRQVHEIVKMVQVQRRRRAAGLPVPGMGLHMVLTGNPGTGKTTVARLIGRLMRDLHVLSSGHVVEVGREDFVGMFPGETEEKTTALLASAAGGILFIDEAYALAPQAGDPTTQQAIAILVAEMENRRDDLVVLAAGYREEMSDFLDANPGLRGRFSRHVEFPDMDDDALWAVFQDLAGSHWNDLEEGVEAAVRLALSRIPRGPGFANAREARKLYEATLGHQASRVTLDPTARLDLIVAADVPGGTPPPATAREDALAALDGLVGLGTVKAEVRRLGNLARIARLRREQGLPGGDDRVGHLAFLGNPGTGKTTVARLLGAIYLSLGVLPSGRVVTVTRGDLVASYLGQTAPKTRRAFNSALGGVLFIDEAYSLVSDGWYHDELGSEALATLLPLMEDYRGQIVVVLAGYTAEMERLFGVNPGLRSRISRILTFPDYTPEEMVTIVEDLISGHGMRMSNPARARLTRLMFDLPRDRTFGNARTARGIFEEMLARQAERLSVHTSDDAARMLLELDERDVPSLSRQPRLPERPRFSRVVPFGLNP